MANEQASTTTRRSPSRLAKTLRALVLMVALGVGLSVWNAYTTSHDIAVATGPANAEQKAFFVGAADRPDIATFYKNLSPADRVKMAENIGKHADPKLAALIVQCLGNFYAPAREALTDSLVKLAVQYPDAVVAQLKQAGSFQQTGVTEALRAVGPSILPEVAKQLDIGEARTNAVNYLVQAGPASVTGILPLLADNDKDTRLAAADALSKLRAREATRELLRLYRTSTEDEPLGYLTALAGIGDPITEDLMTQVLRDEAKPVPSRAQAALGLGRIASSTATATLWSLAGYPDTALTENVISALQSVGDRALLAAPSSATRAQRLAVAAGLDSTAGNAEVASALQDPAFVVSASEASRGRDAMVRPLLATLRSLPSSRGDAADAILVALETTELGKAELKGLVNDPVWGGMVWRRTQTQRG